ncbi:MAG: hypothetical protein JSS53_01695 [Proteobacteria bacterium]|nr:hypothetical protein [Pseudomonadota bacterium]
MNMKTVITAIITLLLSGPALACHFYDDCISYIITNDSSHSITIEAGSSHCVDGSTDTLVLEPGQDGNFTVDWKNYFCFGANGQYQNIKITSSFLSNSEDSKCKLTPEGIQAVSVTNSGFGYCGPGPLIQR